MQKIVFFDNYKGPRGRHLSCLTRTSLFGSDTKPEMNKGIHMRVWKGGQKSNTCKAKKVA